MPMAHGTRPIAEALRRAGVTTRRILLAPDPAVRLRRIASSRVDVGRRRTAASTAPATND
jgi:hypothetical protein